MEEGKKESSKDLKVETNEDEEIDIDLNDPDVEHAAVKIQAGFKGMKARKEVTSLREDKAEKNTSTDKLEKEKQVEKSNVDNSSISPTNDEIDIDLNDPEGSIIDDTFA